MFCVYLKGKAVGKVWQLRTRIEVLRLIFLQFGDALHLSFEDRTQHG